MPIRWKALPVWEALDRIDALLDQAEPVIEEARQEALRAARLPRVPEYVAQPLRFLDHEGERLLKHYRGSVRRLREAIPRDAVERERATRPTASLF